MVVVVVGVGGGKGTVLRLPYGAVLAVPRAERVVEETDFANAEMLRPCRQAVCLGGNVCRVRARTAFVKLDKRRLL